MNCFMNLSFRLLGIILFSHLFILYAVHIYSLINHRLLSQHVLQIVCT